MKTFLLLAILFVISTLSVIAQAPCKRHYEPEGRFSYCAPEGWISKPPASGKYKTFTTPQGSSVIANFNVKDEISTLSNDAYMAAALRLLLDGNDTRGAEARKVVGWTSFTTDSNIKGSRMVYEMQFKGLQMRTLQYILDLPGKKLLITGTTLEQNKDVTDAMFEAVAKSLKVGVYRAGPIPRDAVIDRAR